MNGHESEVIDQDAVGATDGLIGTRPPTSLVAPMELFVATDTFDAPLESVGSITSPFSEAFASLSEAELESQVFDDLVAELEDEEFTDALEALVNEAASRHLGSVATWGQSGEAPVLAESEVERWMESILNETEHILDSLEMEYGSRPLEWFSDETLERIFEAEGLTSPLDAQELFWGAIKKKFKKVVRGAKGLIKKGIKFIGKLNPITRIIAALKKAVRPLLKRLLRRAIGKLPQSLRPVALRLARRLGVAEAESAAGELTEAEVFDLELADYLMAPDEALTAAEVDGDEEPPNHAVAELDGARARLAQQLADLPEGTTPLAEMEQFIPAVIMAARPLIKLGIGLIGRKKVVNKLASIMAVFMSRLVGRSAARALSRHLADSGLRILGFEAEANAADHTLGAEALVAIAEDTIREVAALDPEAFEDEQLLEAEVQEAFAAAAARHVPTHFLRAEVVEEASEGERGVWLMMPRSTAPIYRYKKYSRIIPLQVTRALARSVVSSGGETLERELMEAGADSWPVAAEMELYELLPGGEVGHIASVESGEADDFEELTEEAAAILGGDGELARPGRYRGNVRHSGRVRRVYRIQSRGLRIKKRKRFSVRLDLSKAQPEIRLHMHLSERDAHRVATLLERRQMVQIVAAVRKLADSGLQKALGARLGRMTARRNIKLASGAAEGLAGAIAAATVRTVSKQLPGAAANLATAAKDPAMGATMTFAFPFADQAAVAAGKPGAPALTIRAGLYRE